MKSSRDEPQFALDDWQWLCSQTGMSWLGELQGVQSNTVLHSPAHRKLIASLRSRVGESRYALLAYQAELRERAAKKFYHPENWIWTRTLLEQASDEATSHLVASYFPDASQILDLCCGAGADSVALARKQKRSQPLQCIDQSDVACLLTRWNLESHQLFADVQQQSLQEEISHSFDFNGSWIHLDPDRRSDGFRTTKIDYLSPGPWLIQKCLSEASGGSIKLAPATTAPAEWTTLTGVHWISVGKTVRQQRLWWGCESFPNESITVSVTKDSLEWHHLTLPSRQLDHAWDAVGDLSELPSWIGDVDPGIRAAGATPYLAQLVEGKTLGDIHGYVIADASQESHFIDWFKVEDILPLDVKKLRKHLREKSIGSLEIKKRGIDLDLEKLRRELKLSGDRKATLILVRDQKQRAAILANRA